MIDMKVPASTNGPVQESAPQPLPEAPEPMRAPEQPMPESTATPMPEVQAENANESVDRLGGIIDNLFPSSERIGFMTREAQPAASYENVKLANATGLPQDFVAYDPTSARQNWQEQTTTDALRGHDDVARWAMESPESAKVASENWEDITSISGYSIMYRSAKNELAQAVENASKGWESGDLSAQTGIAFYRDPNSEASQRLDKQLSSFESTLTEETQDSIMYGVGQILGMVKGSGSAFAKGAGAVLAPAIIASSATGVGVIPATGVGALMSVAGIWNVTREVEAGLFVRDSVKRGITPEQARPMAELVGQVNGTLEASADIVFGGLLGKWLKPVFKDALIRAGVSRLGVAEGLQKPSRTQVLGKFGLGVAGTSAAEATTEVMQDVVSSYAENVLDVAQGLRDQNELHTPEGRAKLVAEMQHTWWNVFKASSVLAGIGGAIGLPANYRQARKVSMAQQGFVHALMESQKTRIGQKYPEVMKQYQEHALKEQGIENVYVDGTSFAQAMADANVTMEDLANADTGLAESLQKALDEGGDVVIPQKTFVEHLVGSDLGNRLEADIRLDQEALSARELINMEKRAQELFAQSISEVTKPEVKEAEDARRAELKEIYDDVRQSLRQAGRSAKEADAGAVMVRNFFAVNSERANTSPLEMYSEYGVSIKSNKAEQTQSLQQPDAKRIQEMHRSYAFDKQLELWEQGKGSGVFDLGKPSWVLQIFGTSTEKNITAKKSQFVHVLQPKGVRIKVNNKAIDGKHGISAKELRGLLIAIQHPLAVFESKKNKNGNRSIVLLIEQTRVVDGKELPMVTPVRLLKNRKGELVVENEVKSTYEKEGGIPEDWVSDGILLGYEKTRGLEAVQRFHRSARISSAVDSSNPSAPEAPPSQSLKEDVSTFSPIVYENTTTVEDNYQGQNEEASRGFYSPASRTITLTDKADASTFFHEMGHFFLDVTLQLARSEKATQTQRLDAQTLLDWFGVESFEAWDALGFEGQRKYHEQFAYNYEQYLFEGKAPTGRMKSIFERFTQWLTEVYKDVRAGTKGIYKELFGIELPELSDEVRMVMDRMVASDTAVANASQARALTPYIQEFNRGGMTDEEWSRYLQDHADSIEEAKALLRMSTLRNARHLVSQVEQERKSAQHRIAQKRAELRKKFTEETRKEPFYRAKHFLRTGEMLDDDGNLVGKESNHSINAKYNTGKHRSIANLTTTKGGLDPAFIAELFDLDMTGEEFVHALVNRLSLKDAVALKVEEAMEVEFSYLTDPDAINQEIAEALANETFTRAIAAEYKALKRSVTPAREIAVYAKTVAKQILAKTPWAEVSVGRYNRAEAKARRLAEEAMVGGDVVKAAEFKRQELLNHELAVCARQKRALSDKLMTLRKNAFSADSKLAKSRDMDFVNLARSVLVEFGLATDKQALRLRKALSIIKEHSKDLGAALDDQLQVVRDSVDDRTGKALTFSDVAQIYEHANGLWELSRSEKVSLIEGKRVEQETLLQELVAQGSEELSSRPDWMKAEPIMTGSQTRPRIWTERLLGINASMRRVESWCRAMDGGKRGVFTRYLFEPILDAATQFRTRKFEVLTQVKAALKDLDIPDTLIRAKELDNALWHEKHLNKAQILHILLHCGNESNKRKLALGYGWGKPVFDADNKVVGVNYAKLDNFLNRMVVEGVLTKKDFDAIQRIWDIFEAIKPEAQKAHKEIYGYFFEEVEYQPIQTPFGTYRGGYAPAIVDSARVDDGERRSAEEALGVIGDSFMMPTAPNGFTKSRSENYSKPLLLDLNLIAGHVDKVLRFAYIGPRVREVYRLLGDARSPLTKLINQHDPRAVKEMFIPWLTRAQGQYVSKPSDVHKGSKDFDNICRLIRTRISMAAMAANILNTIQQYTGISVAAARVDGNFLIRGIKEYAINPMGARATVIEKSDWMRQRLENNLFELSGDIEALILPKSKFKDTEEWVMKHAYFMQQHAQNTIDVPVWLGAYGQAIAEGKSEHDAIRHADSVIRDTQGSFNPEDMSRVEAGTPFSRLFTMFYSYFNMQYNLLATEGGMSWVKKNNAHAAYVYFTTLIIPTLLSSALMQLAGGVDCGDDDEFDAVDLMRIGSSEVIKAHFALVPIAGSVANAWIGGSRDRFVPSPAVTAVETVFRTGGYIGRAIEGEDINSVQATKDTLNVISYFSGIPLGQLGKPLGYSAGVLTGDVTPESISDIVRGMLSGRDVNR